MNFQDCIQEISVMSNCILESIHKTGSIGLTSYLPMRNYIYIYAYIYTQDIFPM